MNGNSHLRGSMRSPTYLLVTAWLMILPGISSAQDDSARPTSADRSKVTNDTFTIVEEMPQFPGGEQELFKFLGGNIQYPAEAIEAGIAGVVYVTFVVDKDGSINDVRILRGIGGGCDEESMRVVKAMPNWRPGMQKGKPVKVQYNLPIRFTLRDEKATKLYNADELSLQPRFPGGATEMETYLTANITVPRKARKAKGMVRVQFEVDREGEVKDVKVVGPLHPELDAEVLRVFSSMPDWQPGLVGRSVVRSRIEVDVTFPRP